MRKTHSGRQLVKVAEQNGLRIKNGIGDHVIIYAPAGRGYMVIPLKKELAIGTDHKICAWYKLLGILVVLVLISILLLAVV